MIWHRPVLPGQSLDVLEQASRLADEVPVDSAQGQLSMSRRMDLLLTSGALVEPK